MRRLLPIAVVAAALSMGACTIVSGTTVNGVRLEHQRTVELTGPVEWDELEIDLSMGSIDLKGGEGSTASLSVTFYEKEPGDVDVRFGRSGLEVRSVGGRPYLITNIAGQVPRVPMRLKTNMGSLTLTEMDGVGAIDLESNMGGVALRGAQGAGSVDVKSNMGSVVVERVTVAGGLSARSNMGSVTVTDATSQRLEAHSNMGAVVVVNSQGKALHARSNMGGVQVRGSRFDESDAHANLGGVSISP